MKLTALVLILVLAGCGGHVTTRKVIPERNVEKARVFVVEQMKALENMSMREDDEDYDDFLSQAMRNAENIYGIDTVGWYDRYETAFMPYAYCTPEQKAEIRERLSHAKD